MTGNIAGFLLWWGSLDVAGSLLCLVRFPYDDDTDDVKPALPYLSCWLSYLLVLVLHLLDYFVPSSNPIFKRLVTSTIPLNFLAIANMLVKCDQATMEGRSIITTLVAVLIFMLPGIVLFGKTGYLFFTVGEGTPSPAPKTLKTQRLVIEGPYQYLRNPMVLGKAWLLIGMSLLFHSVRLALFDIAFILICTAIFAYYEEPDLRNRFGNEYVIYCQNVSRWMPRLTPYTGSSSATKKKSI